MSMNKTLIFWPLQQNNKVSYYYYEQHFHSQITELVLLSIPKARDSQLSNKTVCELMSLTDQEHAGQPC